MADRGQGWLTIGKRKKGDVWLHNFYITRATDGKRVPTCRTIGLVSKFPRESDVWAEVERTQQISTDVPSGRLTMNQLIASYKKTELPLKAHSTQELNGATLDNYIAVRWGKFYADEIHVLAIKKWFIAIAEEKKLTRRSIQTVKQVFGRLYSYGAENGLLAPNFNPVRACNIRGIGQPSRTKAIVVPPETAWRIAMSLPIMLRTLVLLAAGTGMRVSELLGLRWGDIDWDAKLIRLNRTWVFNQVGLGKSDASRKPVEMGNRIAGTLREWYRQTPYSRATDWVFASPKLRGRRPISGSQFVKDYIRPRFIEHGLINAEYTGRAGLHAFRHSLATVLITEENVDPKTAQGILRHATSNITMDIYTHVQDAAKRAALERFESRLLQ